VELSHFGPRRDTARHPPANVWGVGSCRTPREPVPPNSEPWSPLRVLFGYERGQCERYVVADPAELPCGGRSRATVISHEGETPRWSPASLPAVALIPQCRAGTVLERSVAQVALEVAA
jgi:hypothetical protein